MIKRIIIRILEFLGLIDSNSIDNKEETIYVLKPIMSDYERKFYNVLKELENDYEVVSQLNLASVIKKVNNNRDLKVQKICDDVNVKLIKFYTSYPNERNYILNRVINEINSK